VRSLENACHT